MIQINGGEWKSPIARYLSDSEKAALTERFDVTDGDVLMLASGRQDITRTVLGKLRTHCGNLAVARGALTLSPDDFRFVWVVDFPLFTRIESSNVGEVSLLAQSLFDGSQLAFTATHHPFTAPVPDDEQLLDKIAATGDLSLAAQIRGQHYDVVVNGVELGGGSIRIHNADRQRYVFSKILQLPEANVNASFKHLIEALDMGCPPHGGLALGFDRMVASMCNEPTRPTNV
jgi:aspartyl-tRNA synthetase